MGPGLHKTVMPKCVTINTLKYYLLNINYFVMCVFILSPFFSDTSTWCHKVCSKTCGKCLLLYNIGSLFIILPKILHVHITTYHMCISRLSWDFISRYIVYHDYCGITSTNLTILPLSYRLKFGTFRGSFESSALVCTLLCVVLN